MKQSPALLALAFITAIVSACSSGTSERQDEATSFQNAQINVNPVPASMPEKDAPEWTAKETALINDWRRLNEQCRGGSGDDPATLKACEDREDATTRLQNAGICYGEAGQSGYQMTIHRCNERSIRIGGGK
ncbi:MULTISPECIES: hypothetical protein [Sphingobium]|jgi:hypothetical protein|uniref:hypothetical protein n=1 Tax=Sphingobium TaxID=165695 RepID=UPI001D18C56B|nr:MULTISPECIES: hypothetical protein [Sphingobium]MCC4258588.1 hypothetical protein [Sphingobium lactosutens]|tara:strand:+ start:15671 stop:16066 length:396 start_codon:yes stop_codon:yes gene_type:complete